MGGRAPETHQGGGGPPASCYILPLSWEKKGLWEIRSGLLDRGSLEPSFAQGKPAQDIGQRCYETAQAKLANMRNKNTHHKS